MKKIISLVLVAVFSLMVMGCGQPKEIGNVKYDTYGFLNADTKKNPNVKYEISYGNLFWSIVLSGSIVFPVYFIGFSLYNPVGPNDNTFIPGKI